VRAASRCKPHSRTVQFLAHEQTRIGALSGDEQADSLALARMRSGCAHETFFASEKAGAAAHSAGGFHERVGDPRQILAGSDGWTCRHPCCPGIAIGNAAIAAKEVLIAFARV
jgi:hypothetical protein